MRKLAPTKTSLCLLFLAFGCLALQVHQKDKVSPQPQPNKLPFYAIPSPLQFVIFVSSDSQVKLQSYNLTNLTQTQKEVDAFIREKAKIGAVNLTAAKGNGERFVYTYQNKTQNRTQNWIISVMRISDEENTSQARSHRQTVKAQKPVGTTTVSPTNAESIPQNAQITPAPSLKVQKMPGSQSGAEKKEAKEKYVITGVNYMESSTLSEDDRKKMEKELKKKEKKFDRLEREFNKRLEEGLKQLEKVENEFSDQWD